MLYIKKYNNAIMINNDIKEIIIDQLTEPLDNISPMVNKITVKNSINIYKRQNRISHAYYLLISLPIITKGLILTLFFVKL